jgi:hypothetical protein
MRMVKVYISLSKQNKKGFAVLANNEVNMNLYRPNMKGCADGNCLFQDNNRGMHTNGGCNCERTLLRCENGFKAVQTIRYLRQQLEANIKTTDHNGE